MVPDKYERYRADLNFIKKYSKAVNAATGSEVDANSNVSNKNIATMATEIHKKANIYANRLAMHDKVKELYGEDLADEYIRQLENHEIYRHDESGTPIGTPYCVSITMYPFLLNGLSSLGGSSTAPKNLDSFCGGFCNLVFLVAAQFAGAVATPEWLAYMSYFLIREYGDDYYKRADEIVELGNHPRTIKDVVRAKFQQVVYTINQPAAARGSQSVFWNVALFDEPYFKSLFETFYFPDGTAMVDIWDSVNWLQKTFMKWLNHERTKKVLTFPVTSYSLLNDGKEYVDKEAADWVAQMYSEGDSFFTYTSDSVDSLASCCFDGDTKILAKSSDGVFLDTTIHDLHEMPWHPYKNNLTVFHNGSWVSAKTIKLPGRPMYVINTSNKKTVKATDNHLWPTLEGLKRTDELTTDDWLLFNTRKLEAVNEKDRHLSYEQGKLIGMYLGDGSMECQSDKYKTVNLSLNNEKYENNIDELNKALIDCGITDKQFKLRTVYNNVYPLSLYGTELPEFIEEYVENGYANEKRIKPEVFLQSSSFRRGILDGMYETDGGNSNRIYTTSEGLARDFEALCSTLGLNTVIDTFDRTDEPVVIRGQAYNRNFVLWCVRWYDPQNKRSMGDVFKIVNNSVYFKITSIEKMDEVPENVYCFECKNESEPYFTLPNGMIVHNCRLKNEIHENTFSYTLGAGGVATGSKCVMTMNLNRLVQNVARANPEYIGDELFPLITEAVAVQTEKIHKYLTAFNEILKEMLANHMLPVYEAEYISLEKQYLTVGTNGLNEAAEFLGIEISDNQRYRDFVEAVFRPISEIDKRDKTKEIMWNTEQVPAENLGVKNASYDKRDGYVVPRDCYNSYFFLSEDTTLSPMDKLKLHGKDYTKYLDGGSACHINLSEHLSKEQYKFIMQKAIEYGTPYFTFNIPNTVCRDCGHISKHYLDKCPKCGSENIDYATRVIGYLTLISKWSVDRQKEGAKRYYAGADKVKVI